MPPLKQIDRSATVGFCPVAPLLAAGTVAGAIDMSFSTNAMLEVCVHYPAWHSCHYTFHVQANSSDQISPLQVFVLDFATSEQSPALGGSIPVPERFNRLVWGTKPNDASQLSVRYFPADGLKLASQPK